MADALEIEGDDKSAARLDRSIKRLSSMKTDELTLQEECRDTFDASWKELGRRPVLLIDNFNLLLARVKDDDYVLRSYFTTPGAPVLVAASTVYPDDLSDYGAAFYDGFKPRYLHPLELDEIRDVIIRLAKARGRDDLANRIHQETPRLAALRDLTGGNPRTAVMLLELFAAGFSKDAYEDLSGLLDIITPLYQSRLDQLPKLGQTIIGTMARHWSPITKAAIAESARLKANSVSPQLGRLRDIGLVEEADVFPGKKTGYQIAERFFNIWYLMRFTTRRKRSSLAGLARFLQEFHTPAERTRSANVMRDRVYNFAEPKKRLRDAVPEDSSETGAKFVEMVLGLPAMVHSGACNDGKSDRHPIASSNLSDDINELVEELKAAAGGIENRSSLEAAAIQIDLKYAEPCNDFGFLLLEHFDRYREAEQSYRMAIRINPNYARPWINLGILLANYLSRYHEAEQAYQSAIEIEPNNSAPWNCLGNLLLDYLGQYDEAVKAYERALDINPENDMPRHNLAFLLQDIRQQPELAKALLKELKSPNSVRDTQALHEALFAAYEDNWGLTGHGNPEGA